MNYWKIIDKQCKSKSDKTFVYCLCTKCNITESKIRLDSLNGNKTTQCVNCYRKRLEYRGVKKYYFNEIRKRAKEKKIIISISFEEIVDLFYSQKEKCSLSGLPLVIRKTKKDKDITASLDRIDSSKGYEKNNVQWVHKDINKLKSNFTEQKFKLLCKLVSIHKSSFSTTT